MGREGKGMSKWIEGREEGETLEEFGPILASVQPGGTMPCCFLKERGPLTTKKKGKKANCRQPSVHPPIRKRLQGNWASNSVPSSLFFSLRKKDPRVRAAVPRRENRETPDRKRGKKEGEPHLNR